MSASLIKLLPLLLSILSALFGGVQYGAHESLVSAAAASDGVLTAPEFPTMAVAGSGILSTLLAGLGGWLNIGGSALTGKLGTLLTPQIQVLVDAISQDDLDADTRQEVTEWITDGLQLASTIMAARIRRKIPS